MSDTSAHPAQHALTTARSPRPGVGSDSLELPAAQSSLPEVLEAVGGELGVAGGVLDVAMSEPFLDGAGVVLAVGEGEAAGMAQHVWVDGEGSSAATPITASCFLNPAAAIGVRRSVVNR